MLLDTGSGCASPLSIDSVAFGVGTWSTSRVSTVQVGQTVLDRYIEAGQDAKVWEWVRHHDDEGEMYSRSEKERVGWRVLSMA